MKLKNLTTRFGSGFLAGLLVAGIAIGPPFVFADGEAKSAATSITASETVGDNKAKNTSDDQKPVASASDDNAGASSGASVSGAEESKDDNSSGDVQGNNGNSDGKTDASGASVDNGGAPSDQDSDGTEKSDASEGQASSESEQGTDKQEDGDPSQDDNNNSTEEKGGGQEEVSQGNEQGQSDEGDPKKDLNDTDESKDRNADDSDKNSDTREKKKGNDQKETQKTESSKKKKEKKVAEQKAAEGDPGRRTSAYSVVSSSYISSYSNASAPQVPSVDLDFRFLTVSKVRAFAKRKLDIKEARDVEARTVGTLDEKGVVYVLKEVDDEWVYVESGSVRGYVQSASMYFDIEAGAVALEQSEQLLKGNEVLAKPTIDEKENEAFDDYKVTSASTVAKKAAAITQSALSIFEAPNASAREVGTIADDGLVYVLKTVESEAEQRLPGQKTGTADTGEVQASVNKWCYVESGSVRGYVPKNALKSIKVDNEDQYSLAQETITPTENRALYDTLTSVKKRGDVSEIRKNIVDFARQYVGNRYVWGGTSLEHGADCSGFVQQVYRHFGYSLPRVSADQSRVGVRIPLSDAKPGDLIFYAKNGRVYHVAIYTGDGGTVEAKNSKVGIVNYHVGGNFCWATRVLNDKTAVAQDGDTSGSLKENLKEANIGESIGEYNISYASSDDTNSVVLEDTSLVGTHLIQGKTVFANPSVIAPGTTLSINQHAYTVIAGPSDMCDDELIIYVDNTSELKQHESERAEVFTVC